MTEATAATDRLAPLDGRAIHIVSLDFDPEPVGIAPYSTATATFLSRCGARVWVATAKPFYPAWRVDRRFRGRWVRSRRHGGVEVAHHALYVPRRPTGARRITHHLSFAASILPRMLWRAWRDRPAAVVIVAPSLLSAWVGLLAARVAGATTWLHVQDFEVEASFATGLMHPAGPIARTALWYERQVLSRCDVVSAISTPMCRRLVGKGVPPDRIAEFRNWADTDAVRPLTSPSPFRDELALGAARIALYSGTIANKQGIEILPRAAARLRHRRDLVWVICGDGPALHDLRAAAAGMAMFFLPLQSYDRLGALLGLADVHLLPQKAEAADLLLPSKLTNMLASGRPIVATARPGTALADEVKGASLIVPPDDDEALAAAIERLLDDDGLARRLGEAGRRRAETRWHRDAILAGFAARLADAIARRGGAI